MGSFHERVIPLTIRILITFYKRIQLNCMYPRVIQTHAYIHTQSNKRIYTVARKHGNQKQPPCEFNVNLFPNSTILPVKQKHINTFSLSRKQFLKFWLLIILTSINLSSSVLLHFHFSVGRSCIHLHTYVYCIFIFCNFDRIFAVYIFIFLSFYKHNLSFSCFKTVSMPKRHINT